MQVANRETVLEAWSQRLEQDVVALARDIGERHWRKPAALARTADYIDRRWRDAGFAPRHQYFEAADQRFANLELELPGASRPDEIVVVGAHYDTVSGSPGANGNGSGVAALLFLANQIRSRQFARTLRLVAFANEEPPFARTRDMGSRVYARRARRRGERIRCMVALETLGCRHTEPNSQRLALGGLVMPSHGDFIALVGNWRHRRWLPRARAGFRQRSGVDCETLALPGYMPGAWSSDHWSFWQEGFPAFMVTDTAPLRYRHYHTPEDTPEKVDYAFLSQVVSGVEGILEELLEGD